MKKVLASVFVALLLSACGTPSVYQQLNKLDGKELVEFDPKTKYVILKQANKGEFCSITYTDVKPNPYTSEFNSVYSLECDWGGNGHKRITAKGPRGIILVNKNPRFLMDPQKLEGIDCNCTYKEKEFKDKNNHVRIVREFEKMVFTEDAPKLGIKAGDIIYQKGQKANEIIGAYDEPAYKYKKQEEAARKTQYKAWKEEAKRREISSKSTIDIALEAVGVSSKSCEVQILRDNANEFYTCNRSEALKETWYIGSKYPNKIEVIKGSCTCKNGGIEFENGTFIKSGF